MPDGGKVSKSGFKAKIGIALFAAAFTANCSGKTYSTFFQPFDIIFGKANAAVDVGLASATPLSPTRVRVKFNKYISLESAENPGNYTITDANGTRLDIIAVTRDPFDSSVVYIDTSLHTAGSTYTLQASNLVGVDGATLSPSASTATYTAPNNVDASAPTINAAWMSSTSKLNITFSEAVDLTTAQTSGNYTFYTDASCTTSTTFAISNLSRDTLNFAKVSMDLNTPNPSAGVTYYVRVNGVKDIWGNTMSNVCSPAWVGFGGAVAPKVQSAVSSSPTSVLITFDSPMTITNPSTSLTQLQTAGNYTFSQCPGANLTMGSATVINSTQVILTSLGNTDVTAGSCKVTVAAGTGIIGANGAALSSTNNTAVFPYNPAPDTTAPSVGTVTAIDSTTIRITFNEPIQTPTASNFTISPSLSIGSITCNASGTSCDITTGTQTTQSYSVTVSGIQDTAGNTMASSTTTFTGDGRPYVTAVIPINATTVRLQWSEPVTSAGIDLGDFEINGSGPTAAALFPSGASSSDMMEITSPITLVSGTTYTFKYHDDGTRTKDLTNNDALYGTFNTPPDEQTLTFIGPALATKPAITSVVATSPTTLRITFNQALDNSTIAETDFSLGGAGCPVIGNRVSAIQVQSGVVNLTLSGDSPRPALPASASATDGCTVNVAANAVQSLYGDGNDATSGTYTYPGSGAGSDTTAPSIVSIVALSSTQLQVLFSEVVDTTTGQTAGNYSFTPALTVGSITCTGSSCIVNVTGQTNTTYTATISGVQDAAGNILTGGSATFYGQAANSATAPTLYMATLIDPFTLEVAFSEQMHLARSQNTGNYTVTAQTVVAAVRQADATKVRLTLSLGAFGSSTSFTVTGAQGGSPCTPTGTTPLTDLSDACLGTPNSATFNGAGNAPSTAPDLTAATDTGPNDSDNITNPFPTPGSMAFTGTVAPNTTVVLYDSRPVTFTDATDRVGLTAHGFQNGDAISFMTINSTTGILTYTTYYVINRTANDFQLATTPGGSAVNLTTNGTGIINERIPVVSAVSDSSGNYTLSITAAPASGDHNYSVGTVSSTGVASATSPVLTVTYDNTPPATPGSAADLAASADTGASSTDNITNDNTPTLSGSGLTAGDYVYIYDGSTLIGAALVDTSGNWTWTLTPGDTTMAGAPADQLTYAAAGSGLTAGAHTITYKVGDTADNESAASPALNLTIDTAAPTLNLPVALMANAYIDLSFTGGGVYGSSSSASPVVVGNLNITLNSGTSGITISPTVTTTGGGALAGGETTIRVNLNVVGTPNGSETVQIVANSNAIFDVAGNALSFDTGVKNFSAAGVPNITGTPTYTSTSATTGYITVVWDEAPYTASGASGVLTASDFDITFNKNSGNANSMTITGFQDDTGGSLDPGETTMRILVSFDLATSGVETFQINAKSGEIFSGISPYNNAPVTEQAGPFTAPDNLAPVISGVSPASSSYITTTQVSYTLSENCNSGSITWTRTGGSADAGSPHTSTLVGSELTSGTKTNITLTNAPSLVSGAIYTVTWNCTDAAGNTATAVSSTSVTYDVTAPTVTNVTSSTANGSYGVGSTISIQVTFSENVTVTGTPQLTLETGASDAVLDYASGTGTNTLTFNYTVAAGHTSSDLAYQSTGALALNGGTIRDAANNNATLTLPTIGAAGSLDFNKALVIDTTAPTVTNVTTALANGTYKAGQVIDIEVVFSEAVNVTGTPQLTLSTGSPATTAVNYLSGSGSTTLVFRYTVAAGNTTSDLDYASTGALALSGGTIRDTVGTNPNDATLALAAPGAANSLGANKDIAIDTTAPTITNVTATNANATYGSGAVISIQITFSEAVTVTGGTPTLTLNTSPSRTASYVSGSGSTVLTFDYTVVSGDTSSDLDYASTGALALAGATIRDAATNDATLTLPNPGAAGSLGANKDIVINAAVTFSITAAETLDCDPVDGIIDHYKITLGAAARDNTFDGYIANSEGLATSKWQVAGRSGVRLHHGTSLPATCGTDTVNDTVIYIKFNQGSAVDTGLTPDITGTNDTLAADSDGLTKLFSNTGNWTTADLAETDKAGPYVFLATAAEAGASEAGVGAGDTLSIRFSERMNAGSLTGVDLDTIFQLNNGHHFGASGDITSAVWSTVTYTNDTLTVTFANSTPTVAVGDTIKLINQATVMDNASNQAANPTAVTSPPVIGGTFEPGQVGPTIVSAQYLDTDADGYIETVRVQFDMTVQDSSFPGYLLNGLGTVTTQWSVAGYNNVRLIHGTAVTWTTDTANDNTIYLRFSEGSTYDTGAKPDLTATNQQLYGPAGGTLGTTACYVNTGVGSGNCSTISASNVLTANVVETDGARPIIVKATAKVGANSVFVSFSENVSSDAAFSSCGSGGQIVAADFTYVDGNSAAPNAISAMATDDCATGDAFVEATANATYNTGDLNIDKIRAATATSIYDAAGNAMTTSREQVIAEATAPYVLAASTYRVDLGGGTYRYIARIFFSEPVSNSSASNAWSALRAANYSVVEDPSDSCTDFSATPSSVTAVGGSNRVFDLQTGAQCSTTRYKVTASTAIKDIDEFENITTPNFAYAMGTAATDTTRPRLLMARSLSATTVELTFSEPMTTGTGANSAECATSAICATEDADTSVSGSQSKYWITPTGLGNVSSVSATADTSVFILTHPNSQQGNFYTVNAYATSTGNRIPRDLNGNNLETAPGNQAVFQGAGTPILSFDDGAIFDDPFSDGTKFNFAFTYQNKVYLGPNDANNAAFRFEPDGLNPVGITFYTAGGGSCNPATSFGISGGSCGAQTIGPNGERGIVSFTSGKVTISSTDYEILLLGPIKDGVTNTYFTQDVDTQLDFKSCTFSVTGGGNTKSIQSSYAFKGNDKYYSGFSSSHSQQAPILAATPLTASGGVLSCGTGSDLTLRSVNWIGKNASTDNPAKSANSNAVVGIDSMLQVPTGGPTPVGEFYVANNGGIASSASPYTSWSIKVTQSNFSSVSGAGAVTLVLPDAPAGLEKVRPGQKGMPVMTIWNGAIYAARNLAVSQTAANQVVNNGGELWKCKATCTTASNWKLVAKSSSFPDNPSNLKAISLLQVNGDRLYIGFDNPTNGATIYRSNTGITEIDSGSGCGDATPDNGDGHNCFTRQGEPGFGSPGQNQYFISSASLRKGSQNFIYVTVGDVNLVAIKVLRQVD